MTEVAHGVTAVPAQYVMHLHALGIVVHGHEHQGVPLAEFALGLFERVEVISQAQPPIGASVGGASSAVTISMRSPPSPAAASTAAT